MNPSRVLHSVVTRLVACMVIGGVVLSASMALLGRARIESSVGMDLTRDMAQTARNVQSLTCGPLATASSQELRQVLEVLTSDADIRAARLVSREATMVEPLLHVVAYAIASFTASSGEMSSAATGIS